MTEPGSASSETSQGTLVPASASTAVRGRRRSLAVLVVLAVLLAGGAAVDLLGVPAAVPTPRAVAQDPADAGRWYCPATAARGESAVVEVATVGDRASRVTVDRYAGGAVATDPIRTVQPGAAVRIGLSASHPSVVRWEGGPVAVTWRATGRTQTIAAPCEAAPSGRWYTAGFDTTLGSTSALHLFNPFTEDATVGLTFATPDGPVRLVATDNLVVPAGRSRRLELGRFQPEVADLGVIAEVSAGRVVAQGEVDIVPPRRSRGPRGRALLRAAPRARRSWSFAYARAGQVSESWLQVLNAGRREAAVEVSVSDPSNDASSPLGEVSVPPGGTARIELAEASRRPEFGVTVTGVNNEAIVVTRLTAIDRFGRRAGVAASLGAVEPAAEWAVVGGGTEGRRDALSIYNAGSRQAQVEVVADAAPRAWSRITVEPNARAVVPLAGADTTGSSTPVLVRADRPVVAELRSVARGDELRLWSAVGVPARAWRGPRTRPPVRLDPGLATRAPGTSPVEATESVPAPGPSRPAPSGPDTSAQGAGSRS
ncbi:hypothetical protein BH20ACT7_BH20ACT7_16580 [soil metagenome]